MWSAAMAPVTRAMSASATIRDAVNRRGEVGCEIWCAVIVVTPFDS
jgi:hypothetical protein